MGASSRFAVAVHMLTLMAYYDDEHLKSEDMACSVNTNPVVIRRIMSALSRASLITSQTGAYGGSRLTRSPSRITLLDVYRAVEGGEIFSLHRQPPDPGCRIGSNIAPVLGDVLGRVETAMERVLSEITIEEILESIGKRSKSKRA